ncbi:hypothetical protein OC846_003430 [Tilletia horrida]|uniref:Glycoside hydrolase family 5 domain-containing protein n=1 Tax=Tilletia horrida TaxID=155126 RepID=A0AAN6JRQ9_9BASI|nr:hypothetical protein OC846_003430 [Tilletia horrida]
MHLFLPCRLTAAASPWRQGGLAMLISAALLVAGLTSADSIPSTPTRSTNLDIDRFQLELSSPLPPQPRSIAITANLSQTWTPPLSTRGRFVVDANGKRFRLQGGNWHGASGTYLGSGDYANPTNHHAGEVAYQTVLCLDRVPIDDIVDSFLELGINTVRLPFSNQMMHDSSMVPDSALKANPQLKGLTPLQIFDATILALTKKGIAVILNNMTNKSLWCCGADMNSRWNSAQTTSQWQSDWLTMVKRYKSNPRVVGADLYNEVRRDIVIDPIWGTGGNYDWWQASFDLGNRILREVNPDLLIVVEGINFVGIPLNGQPHGRPMLLPVHGLSHTLAVQDKLVYSAHFYAYTGPNNTGSDSGPFVTNDPLFRDLSASELQDSVDNLAAYVATSLNDTQQHYSAPVWISEFGVGGRPDTRSDDRDWWDNFVRTMISFDLDYAFWPLVGWQRYGLGDGWALNAWDENGQRLSILDAGDWRLPSWTALQSSSSARTGTIPQTPVWRMLAPDWGGAQQSTTLSNDISWHPGDTKASCPDGLRLIGLSHAARPRGLCTDATLGRELWDFTSGATGAQYVSDDHNVPKGADWARGLTKFQCANDQFVIGYAYTASSGKSLSAICAPIANIDAVTNGQPTGNRTVTFSESTSVTVSHGNWAPDGNNVGSCADDELLVGFATDSSGWPAVLLCRTLNSTQTVSVASSATARSRYDISFVALARSVWVMTVCLVLFGSC